MTVEEAIQTAIRLEKEVEAVYKNHADQFITETGRKLFLSLAEEEAEHVEYLYEKLAEWKSSGTISSQKLTSAVPDEKQIREIVSRLDKTAGEKAPEQEVEFLKKAHEMEKQTSGFYREMVSQLSGEVQALFQRFLEIEEAHETIMKAELDNAKGIGFYFDFMEFDQEA